MNHGTHPRNYHKARYDFDQLTKAHPALAAFVRPHPVEGVTVDFNDPAAVKALNTALLKFFYGIQWWDFPAGHLCPPVPGRADYIHALSDLLGEARGVAVRLLDVGVGANCIYPLLAHQLYGWSVVGSDISMTSLLSARKIVESNRLSPHIELRHQPRREHIFHGIVGAREHFSVTMCNPPFHSGAEEAHAQSARKRRNLGQKQNAPLNFGGVDHELWCDGGELKFIRQMIDESRAFASQCSWFTTLVSKDGHLRPLEANLQRAQVVERRILEMAQGQKKSRVLAWRFKESS